MNLIQKYIDAGFSLVRIKPGTKEPAESWKRRSGPEAVRYKTAEAFGDGHDVAVATGAASGGLEVLDFDNHGGTIHKQFNDLCKVHWLEIGAKHYALHTTPSGGYHLIFRCYKNEGNRKLAKNKEKKAMIESRGDGGYFLVPPSPGYEPAAGSDMTRIEPITPADRDKLFEIAQSLNYREDEEGKQVLDKPKKQKISSNLRQLFNKERTVAWLVSILELDGWRREKTSSDGNVMVARPGKDRGHSGSVKEIDGVPIFYVFSTSTNFESERGYSPYDVCQQIAPQVIESFQCEINSLSNEVKQSKTTPEDVLQFFWGFRIDRVSVLRAPGEEAKIRFCRNGKPDILTEIQEVYAWHNLENRFILEWDVDPRILSKDEKKEASRTFRKILPQLPRDTPEEEGLLSFPLTRAIDRALEAGVENSFDSEGHSGIWQVDGVLYLSFDDFVVGAFRDETKHTRAKMVSALKQAGFEPARVRIAGKQQRVWRCDGKSSLN